MMISPRSDMGRSWRLRRGDAGVHGGLHIGDGHGHHDMAIMIVMAVAITIVTT